MRRACGCIQCVSCREGGACVYWEALTHLKADALGAPWDVLDLEHGDLSARLELADRVGLEHSALPNEHTSG